MSRSLISETPDVPFVSPVSVTRFVPGIYLDDLLFLEVAGAFDDLFAPTLAALDSFAAYLDPFLAPEDFLEWLAGIVGADFDGGTPPGPARRRLVADAVPTYRIRGTAEGIRRSAAAAVGVPVSAVRVTDPGGVAYSTTYRTAVPPPPGGLVKVRVTVPKGTDPVEAAETVRAAIETERPVHCPVQVEVAVK